MRENNSLGKDLQDQSLVRTRSSNPGTNNVGFGTGGVTREVSKPSGLTASSFLIFTVADATGWSNGDSITNTSQSPDETVIILSVSGNDITTGSGVINWVATDVIINPSTSPDSSTTITSPPA